MNWSGVVDEAGRFALLAWLTAVVITMPDPPPLRRRRRLPPVDGTPPTVALEEGGRHRAD